jgi:uncharacterized protein YeaO (DUF488 family)
MAIRIVRLGADREPGEGLRIGTVRRPPRGVPKTEFSSGNWYDVWFPNLSPSPETMAKGRSAEGEKAWQAFRRSFLKEMSEPGPSRDLDLLAALSHSADLSIGCYCEEERRCHRSILHELLEARGAKIFRGRFE